MTDSEKLEKALTMVEALVQDMAEAGIGPQQRAIALALHMQKQAELAMPTKETARAFKVSLATG